MAFGSKISQLIVEKKTDTTTTNTNTNTNTTNKSPISKDKTEEDDDCGTCELLGVTDKKNQMFQLMNSSNSSSGSGNKDSNKNKEQLDEESKYWLPIPEPPNGIELGNSGWTLLHTIAAYYPDKPSETKKKDTKEFLNSFSKVYPCKVCAKDMREFILESPPKLDSQFDFSLWLCQAHNSVNKQLGKPEFDCNLINKRWRINNSGDNDHF